MTDLSVTRPIAYAAMTTACWAVPAAALVWGLARLRRHLRRPCGARFETALGLVYTCTRFARHGGAHSSPKRHELSYDVEWFDLRDKGPAGKDPAPPP